MGHPESLMRRLHFCVVFQKHTTAIFNGGPVECKARERLPLESLNSDLIQPLNTLNLSTISILYGPSGLFDHVA